MGVTIVALTLSAMQHAKAAITVLDANAHRVVLQQPARRIVALSPQLLELAYAAGAGHRVVGTVNAPDLPQPAKALPRVGDAFALNLEAIVSLHPDLILAWKSGTPQRDVALLREFGIPIYWSETANLHAIAHTVKQIGALAGTQATANTWAQTFVVRLDALRERYASRAPVRVFYEVWPQPLMTVGGSQLISQAIALCGGVNPFASLKVLTPTISREAVLAANPQLIVAAGPDPGMLASWQRYAELSAVKHHQLAQLDARLLPRMGSKVLDGVEQLCRSIAGARRADAAVP